jgi:hypothetical protein
MQELVHDLKMYDDLIQYRHIDEEIDLCQFDMEHSCQVHVPIVRMSGMLLFFFLALFFIGLKSDPQRSITYPAFREIFKISVYDYNDDNCSTYPSRSAQYDNLFCYQGVDETGATIYYSFECLYGIDIDYHATNAVSGLAFVIFVLFFLDFILPLTDSLVVSRRCAESTCEINCTSQLITLGCNDNITDLAAQRYAPYATTYFYGCSKFEKPNSGSSLQISLIFTLISLLYLTL